LRSAIVIVLAAVCAAPPSVRAQEDPWGDAQRESESARAGESPRLIDPPRPGEQKQDDTADDPEAQSEVEKGAAELEAVRKAEEKAGLLPQPPGAGPRDGISVGLDPTDPLARDLSTAQGTGLDGAPLGDPAPAGSVSVKLPSCSASPRRSCGPSTTSRSSSTTRWSPTSASSRQTRESTSAGGWAGARATSR